MAIAFRFFRQQEEEEEEEALDVAVPLLASSQPLAGILRACLPRHSNAKESPPNSCNIHEQAKVFTFVSIKHHHKRIIAK